MAKFFIDLNTFQLMDYFELKARPEFNDPNPRPGWPADVFHPGIDGLIEEIDVARFYETDPPAVEIYQVAIYDSPDYWLNPSTSQWERKWTIRNMTPQELDELNEERQLEVDEARRERYEEEADPLFFQAERKETTKQKWLDKIEEIKTDLPDPAPVVIPE